MSWSACPTWTPGSTSIAGRSALPRATEGYVRLADALVGTPTGELLDVGASYVRFALSYPAHFEVMFRPDLYHADDPELDAARRRSGEALRTAVAQVRRADGDAALTGLAAWSIAHGFATLWASGAMARTAGDHEPVELFRACARLAFTTVHKRVRR